MGTSYFLLAAGAWIIYSVISRWLSLRKNIGIAKESGLPYVVVPFYQFSLPWYLLNGPVFKFFELLPTSFRPAWLDDVQLDQTWFRLSEQYAHTDCLTYLLVSPGGIVGWTANAGAINEIMFRRNDFPKPTHIYSSLDIFGKNIVSTEGHTWRRQRKVTSPSFSEKNNYMVWNESILQADFMLQDWASRSGSGAETIKSVAHDCMRLSLHVISKAGFGIRLLWPGIETDHKGIGQTLEAGHTMTFTNALEGLLNSLLVVVSMPQRLLRIVPLQSFKLANESLTEWSKYMDEMVEAKKIQLSSGEESEGGMDLMGALVKSAGFGSDSKAEKGQADYLTDQEIKSNAFVFILAGHETTANTIHYALLFLAMEPNEQRKLQEDIDLIFKGVKPSEWDYDTHLPHLFGGRVGAVMNETLRVIPPALNIPKYTLDWQPITIDGKQYKVPPKVMLNLSVACAHRDPRSWPCGPPVPREEAWHPTANLDDDLNEFRPARWLLNDGVAKRSGAMPSRDLKNTEAEEMGVNTAADTAESLFKPPKGAYIPFSEGFRSCIGRRFAQVEVLVVLARIMSEYSVEFAVDKYATDEEVEAMSNDEKRDIWKKARRDARETLRTKMGTIITIQLRAGAYVPLRFVRRGNERFPYSA